MFAYVARRLAMAVGTVLAAVVISFLLVHASSGSPGAIRLGASGTPAADRRGEPRAGLGPPAVAAVPRLPRPPRLAATSGPRSSTAGRSAPTWPPGCRSPPPSPCSRRCCPASSGVVLGVTAAVRGGRFGRFITSSSGVALSLPAVLGRHPARLRRSRCSSAGCPPPATCRSPTTRSAGSPSLLLPVLTLTVGGAAIVARTANAGHARGPAPGAHPDAAGHGHPAPGGSATCTRCATPACRSSRCSASSSSRCSAAR